ncbi:MAG: hypothetical protein BroJett039_13810 [Chloroflexota bacterium]|nr:MAG: hypothetical protein BroJett039_13810 [Chloroflexota bacterium]
MSATQPSIHNFRAWHNDLGVALVVLVALALGFGIKTYVTTRTQVYQEPNSTFQIEYPKAWTNAESLQEVLLKVEDPTAASAFKTSLTIEARDLDPSAPPTLQTLVDRRVQQRGALTAYHFIANHETQVDGAPAQELQYTYVTQPIDAPRRVALPVVVIARDYIVLTPTRSYYITLAAPENEYARASETLDRILPTVNLQ